MKICRILVFMLTALCLAYVQRAHAVPQDEFHEKYKLVQVIVLSRHNIRAPFNGPESSLNKTTDHIWHDFGVAAGELTPRGAQMEEYMGRYFRQYVDQEGLFSAEYLPEKHDICFAANSFQRTIATAQSFAKGFLPGMDVGVDYRGNAGDADPTFLPGTAGHKEAFAAANQAEVEALGGSSKLLQDVAPGIKVAAKVLDRPVADTTQVTVAVDDELRISENFRPLMKACDALTLQYYEMGADHAAFGQQLSFKEWQEIAAVKDMGIHLCRNVPTLSRALSRPLLSVIQEELNTRQRKFTFLCGHDINIASVMGAMEVKNTTLPETIEQEAPIGCKIVVEEWEDKTGESFINLKLVYPTSNQLAKGEPLTAANPPEVVPLHLQNIHANEDGLLTMQDFQQRLTDAIVSDAELMGIHY